MPLTRQMGVSGNANVRRGFSLGKTPLSHSSIIAISKQLPPAHHRRAEALAIDSLRLHSACQELKEKQKKESSERKEMNFWREHECYSIIAVEIAPCFLVQIPQLSSERRLLTGSVDQTGSHLALFTPQTNRPASQSDRRDGVSTLAPCNQYFRSSLAA